MTNLVQYNNSNNNASVTNQNRQRYISGGYNMYLISLGLYKVRMRSFEL